MNLNPPPWVRRVVYILCTLGAPIVIYLTAKGTIGPDEVTLWTGIAGAATLMAGLNVTPQPGGPDQPDNEGG